MGYGIASPANNKNIKHRSDPRPGMSHKLLIIQPSYYRSKADRTVFKSRRRSVVPLTLPYLAALTPADWDVTLLDEQLNPVPFDGRFDLVAISSSTLNSFRAYDIADEFRRRGVSVILGGPHTFFHAEEAGEHCDAVGVGEGESIWRRMLEDARGGRLNRLYRADPLPDLAGLPLPRYDLLDLRRYRPFRTFAVTSSRGCPFRCEFCSERFLLGENYRCRPVPEVIAEVRHCHSRSIFFGDSNFSVSGKKLGIFFFIISVGEVTGAGPSLRSVLCFVDAEWGRITRSFTIDDVIVTSMRPLAAALHSRGPLNDTSIRSLTQRISVAFPSYDTSLGKRPHTP